MVLLILLSINNWFKSVDVGACEYINKSKMKMEFEDQLHTEHSKHVCVFLVMHGHIYCSLACKSSVRIISLGMTTDVSDN